MRGSESDLVIVEIDMVSIEFAAKAQRHLFISIWGTMKYSLW